MLDNTRQSTSEDASQGTGRQKSPIDKYQSRSKALLYYPEENHVPNQQACNNFNARLMKHIMKKKMQKNESFFTNKVQNGDNNFLRRQVSVGGAFTRQRPASRQIRTS